MAWGSRGFKKDTGPKVPQNMIPEWDNPKGLKKIKAPPFMQLSKEDRDNNAKYDYDKKRHEQAEYILSVRDRIEPQWRRQKDRLGYRVSHQEIQDWKDNYVPVSDDLFFSGAYQVTLPTTGRGMQIGGQVMDFSKSWYQDKANPKNTYVSSKNAKNYLGYTIGKNKKTPENSEHNYLDQPLPYYVGSKERKQINFLVDKGHMELPSVGSRTDAAPHQLQYQKESGISKNTNLAKTIANYTYKEPDKDGNILVGHGFGIKKVNAETGERIKSKRSGGGNFFDDPFENTVGKIAKAVHKGVDTVAQKVVKPVIEPVADIAQTVVKETMKTGEKAVDVVGQGAEIITDIVDPSLDYIAGATGMSSKKDAREGAQKAREEAEAKEKQKEDNIDEARRQKEYDLKKEKEEAAAAAAAIPETPTETPEVAPPSTDIATIAQGSNISTETPLRNIGDDEKMLKMSDETFDPMRKYMGEVAGGTYKAGVDFGTDFLGELPRLSEDPQVRSALGSMQERVDKGVYSTEDMMRMRSTARQAALSETDRQLAQARGQMSRGGIRGASAQMMQQDLGQKLGEAQLASERSLMMAEADKRGQAIQALGDFAKTTREADTDLMMKEKLFALGTGKSFVDWVAAQEGSVITKSPMKQDEYLSEAEKQLKAQGKL